MINSDAVPVEKQRGGRTAGEPPGVTEPQRGSTESVAASEAWFSIVILARISVAEALAYATSTAQYRP
jgi:hypothetical protein